VPGGPGVPSGPVAVPSGPVGIAAVAFLTAYRLAELLGAASLAGAGRRPVSTPVIAAAVRRALAEHPGVFAPVAAHSATERALVASYTELSDVGGEALAALAAANRRAHDVVDVTARAREWLGAGWYDESDLTAAAVARVRHADEAWLAAEIGHLVVHLPQDMLRRQAELVAAVAARRPTTVVVGVTGRADADAGVVRSLGRLGAPVPAELADPPATPPRLPVGPTITRIVTTSDADDEVRAAVRRVIDEVRAGTPLERIGILFGPEQPYGRLVHEQLAAAGILRNGSAVRPLAATALGRTVLDVLALPDHDFRRGDVLGLLARAGVMPTAAWERISRTAGVVSGRSDWDMLLGRFVQQHTERARTLEDRGDERDAPAVRHQRRLAEHGARLRSLVLAIIDGHHEPEAGPGVRQTSWAGRVRWLRGLLDRVTGGAGARARWPDDEVRAADKIESALDRLCALDDLALGDGAGGPPLDVFRTTLEIELEADLGRVGRFGEGVLVAPLSFAVGLDLDLVVFLGLAEGSLPAPVHDDALLPDNDRLRAGDQLDLRRDRIGRDHRRLLAALAAAERHLLCLPRGDLRASNERVPSRWLADVAAALAGERVSTDALGGLREPWIEHVPSFAAGVRHWPFPATEQEYRLRAGLAHDGAVGGVDDPVAARGATVIRERRSFAFTRFDGNLAGIEVPTPHDTVVSSTRLEGWAKCPFAYFGQRLLEVEPVEDPERELEMTPLVRGSLVHEVLERFISDVVDRPPDRQPGPDDAWTPDDHALIRRIATEVCDGYESQGITGRPVFWRRDRAQVIALAERFLLEDEVMRRSARTRPRRAEHAFGREHGAEPVDVELPSGRALRFSGSADRIDEGPGGSLLVLDYKTGRDDDYRQLSPENPDLRGTKLQLAVYAQAARAFAGRHDAAVRSEYWFVSDRVGFTRQGYDVDDDVLAKVTATLDTIVAGIERGVFPHHPDDAYYSPFVTCPYCDPDGLGVADLRRQWERKRDDPVLALYADLAEPREPAGDEAAAR
jgi:ATP-dependent helicase/nuclease subunit B